MYEQIDFRFRYQVGINSIHATLLLYLQSKHTEFPREQMILWSLSAFWYPLACKWLGKFTEAELKQKARNAIYQLQQQIHYLAQIFGLDPQEFVCGASGEQPERNFNRISLAEEPTAPGAPVEALKTSPAFGSDVTPGSESVSAIRPEPAPEMLMHTENDDLLNEVFNN